MNAVNRLLAEHKKVAVWMWGVGSGFNSSDAWLVFPTGETVDLGPLS